MIKIPQKNFFLREFLVVFLFIGFGHEGKTAAKLDEIRLLWLI